ncbi:MAG: DUF2191 domain-containing protein [Planctomycetes bacterium]|nr:DUF2191 domain-containing protein [Planctomycetota bacterium]
MRTTITIDDDLFATLKQEAFKNHMSFKEIVNRSLRSGLKATTHPGQSRRYICRTFPMGYPPLVNIDRAQEIADLLEEEEIVRKLELRK